MKCVLVSGGAGGFGRALVPLWFFTTIGTFPPFNRHYTGDIGAFQLALGAGLLLAVRAGAVPAADRHRRRR
jgi:hypothetical protein